MVPAGCQRHGRKKPRGEHKSRGRQERVAGQTHGNIRQVLQRTLLPGIGDEALPALGHLVQRRGQASEAGWAIIGKLKKASGTVVGNASLFVNGQALEALADKVLIAGLQAERVRRHGMAARGVGRRRCLETLLRGRWEVGACEGELRLELLDALLQAGSV